MHQWQRDDIRSIAVDNIRPGDYIDFVINDPRGIGVHASTMVIAVKYTDGQGQAPTKELVCIQNEGVAQRNRLTLDGNPITLDGNPVFIE